MYDQSRHYPVWFLLETTPGLIDHDSSISFSVQNAPAQSVKSLSYLVFIIDHTRLDKPRQFSFIFIVDQIYTISHVVVLSGFHHRPNLTLLIMAVQFHFWHRPHLYNQSRSYPILFSSQSAPNLISHDSSVSFLVQISPIRMVTSLSCLVFSTHYTRFNQSRQFSIVFRVECTYIIGHVIVLSGFHKNITPISRF